MRHFTLNHRWFVYNLVAVLAVLALLTPAQMIFAQEDDLPACEITDILFDQRQYDVGDTINITVRLADDQGTPLGGAVLRAAVTKENVQTTAAEGFGMIDRSGEYDGQYTNTDLAGEYTFTVTASDPTGEIFAACTESESVIVGDASNEPTPTPTDGPTDEPTPTPTDGPTDEPTPTPTDGPTDEPTPTPTDGPTDEPTPTPTPTDPVSGNQLGPDPVNLAVGSCSAEESMTINLQLVDSEQVVGVELEIDYDTEVVQVVDADGNSANGVQIEAGSGFTGMNFFPVQNEVDTEAGKIFFAATLLGSQLDANAELIVINWRAVKSGTSPVTFNKFALASGEGQSVDANIISGTVTVAGDVGTCVAAVSGQVMLEGRSDHSGVTITGSTGEEVTTDADGNYVVSGGEPVILSKPGYLQAKIEVGTAAQMAGGDMTASSVGAVTLVAGDINQDGEIDILDLAYIAKNYQGNDSLADLTGDGSVNIFDLSLAANNYGETENFGLQGPKELPTDLK